MKSKYLNGVLAAFVFVFSLFVPVPTFAQYQSPYAGQTCNALFALLDQEVATISSLQDQLNSAVAALNACSADPANTCQNEYALVWSIQSSIGNQQTYLYYTTTAIGENHCQR